MIMPASQNRSNYAFHCGFLRLVTKPTAKSGFKVYRATAMPKEGYLQRTDIQHLFKRYILIYGADVVYYVHLCDKTVTKETRLSDGVVE